MYSQSGEDKVILEWCEALDLMPGPHQARHVVDLGAGDGYFMSNSRALIERGFIGHLYDGHPSNDVKSMWITLESIAALDSVPCDVLSIDLDGNDYWILDRFLSSTLRSKPAIVVAEINPIFERHVKAVIPYNSKHVWHNDTYYGMSLGAVELLALKHGYVLAHLHAGINAFLLRQDLANIVPSLVRPVEYRMKIDHKRHPSKLRFTYLNL